MGQWAGGKNNAEKYGNGSGTSSLREMKPDPMPRTSRDAGPYLEASRQGVGDAVIGAPRALLPLLLETC